MGQLNPGAGNLTFWLSGNLEYLEPGLPSAGIAVLAVARGPGDTHGRCQNPG